MPITKKVLVVDDEAPIRRVMELKLRKRGYDVITAVDGEMALALIRSEHPDAVITDINMPRMDGKALCETTDSLKNEHPFLTIVTTCRILPDEQRWISGLQDTFFMAKPFSPARMVERIDRYFSGQE